jgi:hypothetical protein
MAGFIRWVAARYDRVQEELRQEREERRVLVMDFCQHPRTASIAADLLTGFEFFLEYAMEQKVLSEEEFENLFDRLSETLVKLLKQQNRQLEEQDPVTWFLELLAAALINGTANVANEVGGPPLLDAQAWGWEERSFLVKKEITPPTTYDEEEPNRKVEFEESTALRPKGERIGWLKGDNLYLHPTAALSAAQKVAKNTGQYLPLNEHTLGACLREKGLLVSRDENRKKNTTRLRPGAVTFSRRPGAPCGTRGCPPGVPAGA